MTAVYTATAATNLLQRKSKFPLQIIMILQVFLELSIERHRGFKGEITYEESRICVNDVIEINVAISCSSTDIKRVTHVTPAAESFVRLLEEIVHAAALKICR